MSKITRRAVMTGSVAGAAAIVADAVSSKGELTPALANQHADAELLELERRLEALLPPMAQAMDAHSEAHNRATEMMPQEAAAELKYCGNDARLGLDPPPHCVWNKHQAKDQRDKWLHKPRACEIEPRTMEGVAIKARLTAFDAWLLTFNDPEPDIDWHEKVARGFVAEMMRLGGRDFLKWPWEVQA